MSRILVPVKVYERGSLRQIFLYFTLQFLSVTDFALPDNHDLPAKVF